jgi:hypothetical protein
MCDDDLKDARDKISLQIDGAIFTGQQRKGCNK